MVSGPPPRREDPWARGTRPTQPAAASGRTRLERVALVAVEGGGLRSFPIAAGASYVIGRSKRADVAVDHGSVSREHAKVSVDEFEIRLEDLGSTNGTFVGERRLAARAPTPVEIGTAFKVGDILFVVKSAADDPASAPAPKTAAASAPTAKIDAPAFAAGSAVVVDPAMRALYQALARVAAGTVSVLLSGETGVGKEVVARALHDYSPRAAKPFVVLNCAALPSELLESELFGHEKGSFTGAVRDKPGLLETADGGTFFLDEIGEMPLATQAKLLRVLEAGASQRVGALRPRPIDVRFVAATNRDVPAEIEVGRFRRDLYYRLSAVSLAIPPLRERPSDLTALAQYFADEASAQLGRAPAGPLPGPVVDALRAYPWPGNVRELRNVMHRAVLLAAGEPLRPEHLADPGAAAAPAESRAAATAPPSEPAGLKDELKALERERIRDALDACGGNQSRAASRLGISRRSLSEKLDAYGFPRPRKGR
jgi:two-component system, NtrC family, response regulator AtoC